MSRVADLLNDPIEEETGVTLPPIHISQDETRQSLHKQQPSIVSPLVAMVLEEPSNIADQVQELDVKNEFEGRQQNENGTTGDISVPPEGLSQNITQTIQDENIRPGSDSKISQSTEVPPRPLQIKREDSLGPASIRGSSPASVEVNMAPKPGPKKKTAGAPKKPGVKRRKLNDGAETPQSQRSGTPNSTLGTKPTPKGRRHNSATPLHSSPGAEEEVSGEESDDGVYCICRKGDDHTWMIGCEGGCDDWFHGRCVGIEQREGKLIDRFICPNCTESKGEQTTWKILCRLEGCREPAAISGPHPSKYCCDDHATQFFRRFIKKGLGIEINSTAKKRRKDNMTDYFSNAGDDFDKPAHLRGGLLSTSELKAITNERQSYKELRSLGETVPSVHEVKDEDAMQVESEQQFPKTEADQLEKVMSKAAQLRHQLKIFENRERFLGLVKNRAQSACEEYQKKDKSMKAMCGFDVRLRLSESEFDAWCESAEGKEAFATGKLLPEQVDTDGDANMTGAEELGKGLCLRKRCKQHEGWFKLHTLEFQFGKSDVRRDLARAAAEEQAIRERATIRQIESKSG